MTSADIARNLIATGIRFEVARHAQGQIVEVATSDQKILGRWVTITRTIDQSLSVSDPQRTTYSVRMASGRVVSVAA